MKKYIYSFTVLLLGVSPAIVRAQGIKDAGNVLNQAATPAGVTAQGDVGTIVGTIINAALTLVGTIFLVLMIYAGFMWMTARGKEESITKAKQIIIGSIIGLVIVVSAYAITFFVTSQFQ
ncbi:MAG: hypothetical protein ABII02_03300 [Candidatus Magasanikbacteria bacterium]